MSLLHMFKKYVENFKLSSLKSQKPILAGENNEKMSECLRTYGPQIIRVPQLQIED